MISSVISSSVRIVLDTSVVVAALRSASGASAKIIELILTREIVLCLDYKMICEYRDVAARLEHRKASGLSIRQIEDYLSVLEDIAEPIRVKRRYRGLSPDPSDDMVLELAINAASDAIVTFDLRHLKEPGNRFDIRVLTPGEFLEWIRTGGEHASKKEPGNAS
jgi:putative PIN family toxin of toxin-antitoxin system